MTYAQNTTVDASHSRDEIERTLKRYGATAFSYAWDSDKNHAAIQFRMNELHMKFLVSMPLRSEFERTPTGKRRYDDTIEKSWEQGMRQRWRALALIVKAKLEAVEGGIATFEGEFLAYIMLPDNSTVADFMLPQVARAYETGKMPDMLPMLPPGDKATS